MLEEEFDTAYIMRNIRIAIQPSSNENIVKKETEFEGIEAYLCVYEKKSENERSMLKLNEHTLKDNGISIEEAWKQAELNNRLSAAIRSMDDMLAELGEKTGEEAIGEPLLLHIATNRMHFYGAAVVLDKELLRQSLPLDRTRKWQVVFSSVHQAAIIPDDDNPVTRALLETAKLYDRENISPKDRLTDEVYKITL